MSVIGRLLPGSNGTDGKQRRIGSQCETALSRSFLTALGRDAAQALNERIAAERPDRHLEELAAEPVIDSR